MASELRNWITEARKRGTSYRDISKQLKTQGYTLPEIIIASTVDLLLNPVIRIPLIILLIGTMLALGGLVSHLTYDTTPKTVYPEATMNYNDVTLPQARETAVEQGTATEIETTPSDTGFTVPEEESYVRFNVTETETPAETNDTTEIPTETITTINQTSTTNETNPTCTSCQYLENNTCISYVCCDDLDCADGISETTDKCENPSTKEAKCTHSTTPKTQCKDNDGICPEGCTFKDDTDCNVTDQLFMTCGSSIQCYHDAAVANLNTTLCDNLNFYWEDANLTATSTCYYNIATSTNNCDLCDKIKKTDIKTACTTAVCS